MNVVAGMDVGGTKTRAKAIDSTGRLIVDAVMATPTWSAVSDEERATGLARLVQDLFADLNATRVTAGVHGCDSSRQHELFVAAMRTVCPDVVVVNDAQLLLPAMGYPSGTAVIAGTGSVASSATADGTRVHIGGWGPILGDGGSASALVRDAAKASLRLVDEDREDILKDLLFEDLEIRHPRDLPFLLGSTDAALWASSARAVFAAEEAGSTIAKGVVEKNLDQLVALLSLVQMRGGDITTVVTAGGVITAQSTYFSRFAHLAKSRLEGVRTVELLTVEPVDGAVALAKQSAF